MRHAGPALSQALGLLENEVGQLSVLVETLDEPRAPLWGDANRSVAYPEWIPYDRVAALDVPAYKGFAPTHRR